MNIPDFTRLGGNKLGEAVVEIRADAKGYNSAIDKAGRTLSLFASSAPGILKGVGIAFAAVTGAATALGAAMAAIAVKGLREFATFQQGTAEISTLLQDDVDRTINALGTGMRQLSLDIPQTTELMNKALYDIISAGTAAGESLGVLGKSGKAAVAGVSEIGTAAKLGTSTINALGLATKDMDRVFDVAFGTVRVGVTTFSELAYSIGDVLPPASKLGVSMEELFGSMAYLTKVGQSSAEASTALGRAFEALIAHAEELKGFGVEVFGTKGEFVGVLNVMKQISGVVDGLSDKERADVLDKMGLTEIRAQRAIVPMIMRFQEFEKVVQDVTNSGGAMEEAYSRMEGTLVNQWKLLTNATSELKRTIGEHFAGIATSAISSIADMVNKISRLIGSSEGGMGQLWADHGELVSTILTQMAVAGIETISIMVRSMAKTMGQAAKNMLSEALSPERIKQDYVMAFQVFSDSIKAIAKGDIEEIGHVLESAALRQTANLEDFRAKQTKSSDVMASEIGNAVQKIASQYKSSYDTINAKIDEHVADVVETTKETSSALIDVSDTTVKSVANSVQKATGMVVPAMKDMETAFMAIQDNVTRITQHQENERTKETQKALQTRELVFREYNDKWSWFNGERYESWKESTDNILETESTADGLLTRLNAKGQAERLGQQKKNGIEIAANHQAFADETNAIEDAKNKDLITSEETTNDIIRQLDEDDNARRIEVQKVHWDEYVSLTADGVNSTANAWRGIWEIWNNTEMEWDKFHQSSIGKLTNWVDKVAKLINDVSTTWKNFSTILAGISTLLGGEGGGGAVGAGTNVLGAASGSAGLLGKVGGGIKAGAGAVAGLPWGSMAGTAAAWTPTAIAGIFYAGWAKFVGEGMWNALTGGGKEGAAPAEWERKGFASEEAFRKLDALADKVTQRQQQQHEEAMAQSQRLNNEGARHREQIQLDLARYSAEELKHIYETSDALRGYINKTWEDVERRGIAGGRYGQQMGNVTIQAGVLVADEYSMRELAEKLAPYL